MDKWKTEQFHPLIEQHSIRPECIYNGDQVSFTRSFQTAFMLKRARRRTILEQNR